MPHGFTPEPIYGTRVPNTEAGVRAFTNSIRKLERERITRNQARERGDYSIDYQAAELILDALDEVMTHDINNSGENGGNSLKERLDQARYALADERPTGLADALGHVRDRLAGISSGLATDTIRLDTLIKQIMNGEPDE